MRPRGVIVMRSLDPMLRCRTAHPQAAQMIVHRRPTGSTGRDAGRNSGYTVSCLEIATFFIKGSLFWNHCTGRKADNNHMIEMAHHVDGAPQSKFNCYMVASGAAGDR